MLRTSMQYRSYKIDIRKSIISLRLHCSEHRPKVLISDIGDMICTRFVLQRVLDKKMQENNK